MKLYFTNCFCSLLQAIFFIPLFLFLFSCNTSELNTNPNTKPATVKQFRLLQEYGDKLYPQGDTFNFVLEKLQPELKLDSLQLYINGDYLYGSSDSAFAWISGNAVMGKNTLRVVIHYNDSATYQVSTSILIRSDLVPKKHTYKVINTFPHDTKAYTQGLLYSDNFLFESTGHRGQSSLRKVEIETGKVFMQIDLDPNIFGEGLAMVKDELFQITYTAQQGYVYDKEDFSLIRKFGYPLAEGWGLTYDGTYLIMSDGSSFLYFIDPEYYTQDNKIEVYDNLRRITRLNELEYVNGRLFANIYGRAEIVIIDPKSGKVLGKLDCRNLVPEGIALNSEKVLNGIAYNQKTQTYYVTGKYWPVLYEIQIFDL